MKITRDIRKQFGLTQQQLADFIGTDRSALARMETGERIMKAGPLMLLLSLQQAGKDFHQSRNDSPAITADLKKEFREHALYCRHTYTRQQKKLSALQAKKEGIKKLQHTVALLQQQPPEQLTKKQQRWLEEQSYQAEKKMETCSDEAELRLRLQMELLLAEAEIYEKVGK